MMIVIFPLTCAGAGVGTYTGCLAGDYLEISEGSSAQRYCGTSTPAPLTTTNTITVKFRLYWDGVVGNEGAGFLATVCCSVGVTTDVQGKYRVNSQSVAAIGLT